MWKISPEGRKSIAIANVHTHELYIDAEDIHYGEHFWYEGEAVDKMMLKRRSSRQLYPQCKWVIAYRIASQASAEGGE